MDLSFLISHGVGGDSLNVDLERTVNSFLHERNCLYEACKGYGMTELTATACLSFRGATAIGSVGVPFAPYNKTGEIWISGPSIMLGYYNMPTTALISFDEEGNGFTLVIWGI